MRMRERCLDPTVPDTPDPDTIGTPVVFDPTFVQNLDDGDLTALAAAFLYDGPTRQQLRGVVYAAAAGRRLLPIPNGTS